MYTSSWAAPKADVHSQQRFFYMGTTGEVTVDQAHRGYTVREEQEAQPREKPHARNLHGNLMDRGRQQQSHAVASSPCCFSVPSSLPSVTTPPPLPSPQVSKDGDQFRSVNPLFMKYAPSGGSFAGQQGYGYQSFEKFVDAATQVRERLWRDTAPLAERTK